MNKNVGFERMLGTGGGNMVLPSSQKNYEIGAALCKQGRIREAAPYLFNAITEDRYNADAFIEIAFISPTLKDSMTFIDDGLKFGREFLEKKLGPTCFEDNHVGKFWDPLLETRPFMRLMQTRVEFLFLMSNYGEAATTSEEMIRLCPGDNMDIRSWLAPALCHAGRYKDALSFTRKYIDYCLDSNYSRLNDGGIKYTEPTHDLYPDDDQSMRRLAFTKCSLAYTAAYASFKLWGDCDASRQYLKIAAGGCQYVLAKIMSRAPKPTELCMDARMHNGKEDAKDYLYKTQDLWMAEDVWEWLNSNPDAQNASKSACANPACRSIPSGSVKLQCCSSCHQVWYCGQACQKADWKSHKTDCKIRPIMKKAMKAVAEGKPMPDNLPVHVYSADFAGNSFLVTEGSAPSGVVVPDGPAKAKKKKSKKKKSTS